MSGVSPAFNRGMKNMGKKIRKKYKGRWLFAGVVTMILIVGGFFAMLYSGQVNNIGSPFDDLIDIVVPDTVVEEIEWKKLATVYPFALGEYDGGDDEASQWLSFFVLDYAETVDTVLANNATDWSGAATARGYADSDSFNEDLAANDGGYFVCRCRFNTSAKNGSTWEHDRFRVNLTVSGDETISDVGVYDNSSNGDAVVSNQEANWIFINFYWDDESDGYRIVLDGTLTISFTIYEKY